jgi:lysozyme
LFKKPNLELQPNKKNSWLDLRNFLIEVEGKKFKPYQDSAGHLTVGVGHKILPSEMAFLNRNLLEFEIEELLYKDVQKVLPSMESIPELTKNQRIAVISLIFNIGITAFQNSTIKRKLQNNDSSTAEEFSRWIFITNSKTGKKEISKGLVIRRAKEKNKFLEK